MKKTFKHIVPYLMFIGSALIVLLFDFNLLIPLSKSDGVLYDYFPQGIYVMPIIWLIIMCFPIAFIIFYEEKLFNLQEGPPKTTRIQFLISFIGLFALIMIFRTLIIWKYNGPYEKMSIIFFLLFQILLVQQISLRHYGLEARAPWNDWKRDLKYIGFLIIILIVLLMPIIIIAHFIFFPQLLLIIPQMTIPNGLVLISFPFQTIAVGISEELMFRGYLQENLKRFDKKNNEKLHFFGLIILNSFLFGLFHVPWYIEYSETTFFTIPPSNYIPMLSRILSTGAFGLIMCLIYEYTGSLRITILIHGLWNTIGAFLGSMFIQLDFAVFDGISYLQIMLFAIYAIVPLLIGIIILLKTPKYLAKKLQYPIETRLSITK